MLRSLPPSLSHLALVALTGSAGLLAGCGGSDSGEAAERKAARDVVTVASDPAEAIARIALPAGAVERLGVGTASASWSPTDADLGALTTARRVILVGAEFEPWSQRAGLPPSRTLTLAEGLDPAALISTATVTHTHGKGPAHSHGGVVPTVWTDPALLRGMVHGVGELLAGVLPEETAGTAEAATSRRQAFEAELSDYEAALVELKEAAGGRTLFAVAHGLEYVMRAAEAPLSVALLEVDDSGKRNDHAAALLEEEVNKAGDAHAGVLVWIGPSDDAIDATFAAIAERSLRLTSVSFDLGASSPAEPASAPDLLRRMTASTRRLSAAIKTTPR